MKKNYRSILVVLVVLGILSVGANSIAQFTITIGGDANSKALIEKLNPSLNFRVPVNIPVVIGIRKLTGGCNDSVPKEINLTVKGWAWVYYNPDTGESWLRFEKATYEITAHGEKVEMREIK